MTQFDRSIGYSILDLLADVGGLSALLFVSVSYILAFKNFNQVDDFLVSRLFKLKKEKRDNLFENE